MILPVCTEEETFNQARVPMSRLLPKVNKTIEEDWVEKAENTMAASETTEVNNYQAFVL